MVGSWQHPALYGSSHPIQPGLSTILPRMVTDIVLDTPNADRRLIVDTKFTSVLRIGRFGDASLKSGYLYQMYAYLRSQEGRSPLWDTAAGLFLHPAIGSRLHEFVTIQGHSITFATVNLGGTATSVRDELRRILLADLWRQDDN